MAESPYPPYIPLRTIVWGGAASIVTTRPLRIEAVTTADRPLVWEETGWRFVPTVESRTAPVGVETVIEVPPVDLTGWVTPGGDPVDPTLGPTHRYTTTITVYDGDKVVDRQVYGPYMILTGTGIIDGDLLAAAGAAPSPVAPTAVWILPDTDPIPPASRVGEFTLDPVTGDLSIIEES